MKIAPVSGDMLVKVALVAGVGLGLYFIVKKATDKIGAGLDDIGKAYDNAAAAVGDAIDTVTGAPGAAVESLAQWQEDARAKYLADQEKQQAFEKQTSDAFASSVKSWWHNLTTASTERAATGGGAHGAY